MRRTLGFRKVSTFQGVAPLQEEISPVVKPDCTDDEDADDEEKSPSATDDKEVEASLQATPAESVMASDDEFMRVHRSESVPNAVLEWDRDGVSMQTSLRPQGRCQPRCQRTNQQVGWPSKSHIRVADRVSPWLSFPFAGSGLGEIHVFKGKYIYLAELPLPSHDLLISLEGVSWRLNNDPPITGNLHIDSHFLKFISRGPYSVCGWEAFHLGFFEVPLAHVRREVSYDFQNTWSVFSFRVYESHDWCVRIEDTDGIKGFQILKLLRHALNAPYPIKSTRSPSPLDLSYHQQRLGIGGPAPQRRECDCCRAATEVDVARVIPVSM
ncbi:MAG: hypothetical protein KVP17_004903 [Porospora cf. gigantea B]|uniref:uncharacterized protein n=1 Tax=Porospora cf. gigantea B TaxID=2853592 RepID=UPI00357186F6|nr:MAG: hypothetical protein KVP17_004903 [Porospora cf. gigantea B]